MSVASKVAPGLQSVTASAAAARMGDGIRAATAPSAFTPITPTQPPSGVGSEKQALQNQDDYSSRERRSNSSRQTGSAGGEEDGIRLGTVRSSNDAFRAIFTMQTEADDEAPAPPRGLPAVNSNRAASAIYETNTRVVAARYNGEKLLGNSVNRLY